LVIPDAPCAQQVAVGVGHARRLVHRLREDPGSQQRGVEAVHRVREVRLCRRGPQAGVDADEQQADVRTEQVRHLGVAERLELRRG
jgi:hypothetical protein